jgi:hypothetical protein
MTTLSHGVILELPYATSVPAYPVAPVHTPGPVCSQVDMQLRTMSFYLAADTNLS